MLLRGRVCAGWGVWQVGRADKMGLAISLVASCKERVWCEVCLCVWGGYSAVRNE